MCFTQLYDDSTMKDRQTHATIKMICKNQETQIAKVMNIFQALVCFIYVIIFSNIIYELATEHRQETKDQYNNCTNLEVQCTFNSVQMKQCARTTTT